MADRGPILAKSLDELHIDVLLTLEGLELHWVQEFLLRESEEMHIATVNTQAAAIKHWAPIPDHPNPSSEDCIVADAWLAMPMCDRLAAVRAVRATRAGRFPDARPDFNSAHRRDGRHSPLPHRHNLDQEEPETEA